MKLYILTVLKLLRAAVVFCKPKITDFLNEGRRGERDSLTELITIIFNVSVQTQLEAEYRKDSGSTDRKKKYNMSFSCSEKRCREKRGKRRVSSA